MPKAKNSKSKVKKTKKAVKVTTSKSEAFDLSRMPSLPSLSFLPTNLLSSKKILLALGILVLVVVVVTHKSWFIAATVDGSPITNLEVMQQLNSQFRGPILDQMISYKIVFDEAARKGIVVTDSDIDNRIAETEKSYGGAQIYDSVLAQEGQTRESIRILTKAQLSIEKLYQDEATVSAQEVQDFISQNSVQMTATDSAGQLIEAQNVLKHQKISKIFSEKFQQLKQAANIQIF